MLIKIGAVVEARKILNRLSPEVADVDLYLAFSEQAEWDYAQAIPHLRRYLSRPRLTTYETAIAEVNLAASFIAKGETVESRVLLTSLFEKAKANRWTLIYKNLQELLGQLSVQVQDFQEARRFLDDAVSRENYRGTGIFDFFIDKWRAIVDVRENSESSDALQAIKHIRSRATELSHWESVRECDRFLAMALKDQALLDQVYFGTPFPAYRDKLMRDASAWSAPSRHYVWGNANSEIFDLATAQTDDGAIHLKPGHVLHRALSALAAVRYKPLYVGQLFAKTFPEDHFIAEFSEGRISTVISRLRSWSNKHDLNLVFETKEQFYQLKLDPAASGLRLRFTSELQSLENENPMASHLLRLHAKMDASHFTSNQVAETLAVSKSTAVRLLGWAVKEGKLKTFGNNKSKKYGFAA